MTIWKNNRDLILQGASVRNTNPSADKAILLTADSLIFKVDTGGAGSPTGITITAKPLNIPGNVTFLAVPSVTLTGTGNVRTLTFANMTVPATTIQASIAYDGITYNAYLVINKLSDGAVGSDGQRGTVSLYLTGSVWSDAAATAAVGGSPMIGDTVTISNGIDFVSVKTWSGTTWIPPGVVIDGSLLVSNTVTAAKINSNGLSIRDPSGNIILGTGSAFDWTKATASGLTGGSGITNSSISITSSGALLNAGGGNVTIGGLGYTGALDATKNTGLFANLPGTITAANAATYFASNSIAGTYISDLAANKISAGTLAAGVIYAGSIDASQITASTFNGYTFTGTIFQTSSGTGARIVLNAGSANKFQVYNPANILQCEIGGSSGVIYATSGSSVTSTAAIVSTGILPAISADATTGTNHAISAFGNGATEALYGTNSSGGGAGHGIRGSAKFTSSSSIATAIVGASNGYDVYADGAGTNYGPFTGAHDILWPVERDMQLGDIVVDVKCLERSGWSNTLFEGEMSTYAMQRGAVGILSVIIGPLNESTPAVFTNHIYEDVIPLREPQWVTKVSPSYEQLKDRYIRGAVNALGEGQMNVCGENGNIVKGDYIVCSSMRGKGMKQNDDIQRSCTVARAREDVVFLSPDEVKQIACIYLCG